MAASSLNPDGAPPVIVCPPGFGQFAFGTVEQGSDGSTIARVVVCDLEAKHFDEPNALRQLGADLFASADWLEAQQTTA